MFKMYKNGQDNNQNVNNDISRWEESIFLLNTFLYLSILLCIYYNSVVTRKNNFQIIER